MRRVPRSPSRLATAREPLARQLPGGNVPLAAPGPPYAALALHLRKTE